MEEYTSRFNAGNADSVFYFDEGLRAEVKIAVKAIPRTKRARPAGGLLMMLDIGVRRGH